MRFDFLNTLANSLVQRIPTVVLYVVSTSSMMMGIAAQAIAFVILARYLGKDQFGELATISAATSLGAAWVQLGSVEVMRRRVGRDSLEYHAVLGHCVTLIFGWGAIVAIAFSALISEIIHIANDPLTNFGILLLFSLSNLVFYPWIVLTEEIFLVHKKFTRANLVNAGFGIARVAITVTACIGFKLHSLSYWAIWNSGVYLGAAFICGLALSTYGAPHLGLLRKEIPVGITFGISGFLSALRQNADLLALSVVAGPAVVGTYGLARRIISVAVVTGASLDRLVYTRLVIAGKGGPNETLKLARRYVVYAVALTGATSVTLYFIFSPLMPLIFGIHFGEAIVQLRILCWTLILTGTQNIAFDALNAADLHRTQVTISVVAGLIGSFAVGVLTLTYGVDGTYFAVYFSELFLAVSLWAGLALISRHRKRAMQPVIPPAEAAQV